MDHAAIIARMDAQRSQWVTLPDGKRVQFARPLETELGKFRGGVTVEHLCEYVRGWDGFTEADLLGAAIGSSDAVQFSAGLWARVVRDRIAYVEPVAQAMVLAITDHLATREAVAKN